MPSSVEVAGFCPKGLSTGQLKCAVGAGAAILIFGVAMLALSQCTSLMNLNEGVAIGVGAGSLALGFGVSGVSILKLKNIDPLDVDKRDTSRGLFVEVLNAGYYIKNGRKVTVPPAGAPTWVSAPAPAAAAAAAPLRTSAPRVCVLNCSTEEAIALPNGHQKIALNFANSMWVGGGPGVYYDPSIAQYVYASPSATAQEESLCQRSTLLLSLALRAKSSPVVDDRGRLRMQYETPFDSTQGAYVSENHLFACQGESGFYSSTYLDAPVPVTFVTSAAYNYGHKPVAGGFAPGSPCYTDAKQRILAHLHAAAEAATLKKTADPHCRVEVILGAFGCGAFAPQNRRQYVTMIAGIYQELIPQFARSVDLFTFPLPTFGSADREDRNVENHEIFYNASGGSDSYV